MDSGKYRKFENTEVSQILEKTLLISIICIKYKNGYKINKENHLRFFFFFKLKVYNYFRNISQEFILKNIYETRNFFLKEIEQTKFMSKMQQKV